MRNEVGRLNDGGAVFCGFFNDGSDRLFIAVEGVGSADHMAGEAYGERVNLRELLVHIKIGLFLERVTLRFVTGVVIDKGVKRDLLAVLNLDAPFGNNIGFAQDVVRLGFQRIAKPIIAFRYLVRREKHKVAGLQIGVLIIAEEIEPVN